MSEGTDTWQWERVANYRQLQAMRRRQTWMEFVLEYQKQLLLNYRRHLFPDYIIQAPPMPPQVITPTDLNRMLREREALKKRLGYDVPVPEPEPEPEPPSFDSDALNFFTRANITDENQKGAINDLVEALKAANIWTKMRALYPFVGGTAASHSENLKSSSFGIVWNGSITHDANGVTGGANGFGSTGLNVNTTVVGSIAFGVYQRQSVGNMNRDIATLVSDGPEYAIYLRYNDVFYAVGGTSGFVTAPMFDAHGFFVLSRTATNVYKGFKNGIQIGLIGPDPQTEPLPSSVFRLLLDGNPHNLALAFISDGLLDADVTAFNTVVVAYQTALGRNV